MIEVETPWGPVSMAYEVHDEQVIVEGDLVLGPVDLVLGSDDVAFRSAGLSLSGMRWPNGRVSYELDPGLSTTQVNDIVAAMGHWSANTAIRFIPRTIEANWVTFRPGSGCSADVGMVGGEQYVTLSSGCREGEIIHEIGHTVGLWHEQTRANRDDHVIVHQECIQPTKYSNYQTYIERNLDGRDRGAYDLDSIMHYSTGDFCLLGPDGDCLCDTMTTLAGDPLVAQRDGLSAGDLVGIERMYGKRDFGGRGNAGDRFGAAVACGDFDGDGYTDMALGAPREGKTYADEGKVYVYEGFPNTTQALTRWHTIADLYPERNGRLGSALAAGDFDGDGTDDLAIGAPYSDYGSQSEAGLLYLYRGTDQALDMLSVDTVAGVGGGPVKAGDNFAAALAAGDFDCDGIDEVAVGSPSEANRFGFPSGVVHIVKYDPSGGGAQGWDQLDPTLLQGTGGNPAEFGFALAAGDLDGDGCDDLAVGAPNARRWVAVGSGAKAYFSGDVSIFYGASTGMVPGFEIGQAGLDPHENGDRFGSAIAISDLAHDGPPLELSVGAPGEDVGGAQDAGAVYFFRDTGGGYAGWDMLDETDPTCPEPSGPQVGDQLGFALAPYDKGMGLLIGAPGDGPDHQGGLVFGAFSYANQVGFAAMWDQVGPFVQPHDGDRFGEALCAGDFRGMGSVDKDFVVGGPSTEALDLIPNVGEPTNSGSVLVVTQQATQQMTNVLYH